MIEILNINDIHGHEKEKIMLKNICSNLNNIEYLCILGPYGSGRDSFAKIISKIFLCEKRSLEECFCESCLIFNEKKYLNSVEDPTKFNKNISFEKKVLIFTLSEKLDQNAIFNLVYKKPKNCLCIFVTQNSNLVDSSLLDLCITLNISKLSCLDVFNYLQTKYPSAETQTLKTISGNSSGSIKKALNDLKSIEVMNIKDVRSFYKINLNLQLLSLLDNIVGDVDKIFSCVDNLCGITTVENIRSNLVSLCVEIFQNHYNLLSDKYSNECRYFEALYNKYGVRILEIANSLLQNYKIENRFVLLADLYSLNLKLKPQQSVQAVVSKPQPPKQKETENITQDIYKPSIVGMGVVKDASKELGLSDILLKLNATLISSGNKN